MIARNAKGQGNIKVSADPVRGDGEEAEVEQLDWAQVETVRGTRSSGSGERLGEGAREAEARSARGWGMTTRRR